MNADPAGAPNQPGTDPRAGEPSEEELRRAYEAELSRVTSTDMMAQAAVSLLNVGARRLGLVGGAEPGQEVGGEGGQAAAADRDLEQVGDAIDGVRALLGILERRIPQELRPLRDALSQLQMAYAREVQAVGPPGAEGAQPAVARGESPAGSSDREPAGQPGPAPASDQPSGSKPTEGPGPAEASGRLWVPGR